MTNILTSMFQIQFFLQHFTVLLLISKVYLKWHAASYFAKRQYFLTHYSSNPTWGNSSSDLQIIVPSLGVVCVRFKYGCKVPVTGYIPKVGYVFLKKWKITPCTVCMQLAVWSSVV